MVFLIGIGLLLIYSASLGESSPNKSVLALLTKQVFWVVLGLFFFFLMGLIDYRQLTRFSSTIYFTALFLLILVLIIGRETSGAQRWIPLGPLTLQPSEFAKLMILITLCCFWYKEKENIGQISTILRSFVHVGIPTLLVFIQPDLGTSITFVILWLVLLFINGAKAKHLALISVIGLLIFAGAWYTDIIRPYQKKRIEAFLNPEADPLGASYHILQSKIAIGSGEIWGKGLFKGTQNRLNFIPAQHTDFIFTVAGEELGLVGCGLIILLYFLLIWRLFIIALETEDLLGQLLVSAVGTILCFHIFVNIGMTMGLMPAVGIPLPFITYGGSNLFSFCGMLGLVQSVCRRGRKLYF